MKDTYIGLIIIAFLVMGYFGLRTTNHNSGLEQAESLNVVEKVEVLSVFARIKDRAYEPNRIDVPLGATVELTVRNDDNEQHGLFLSQFGVQEVVGPRGTKTIRFTANNLGTSATFCSTTHPEKLTINVI